MTPYKKKFFTHSINMSNPQQNETEQFKRDINLLQDKLKRLKKQNLLQNGKKKIAKTQNGPKQIAK